MPRGYGCKLLGTVVNKRPYLFDCLNKIETSSHDGIKGIWISKEESHA